MSTSGGNGAAQQIEFTELIADMEAAEQARLDEHRQNVQAFFDGLTREQKRQLGEWLQGSSDYLTFQALAAAAGDWHRSHRRF